jgi:DNA-binding FadR family transcriptional regulator
VVTAGRSAPTGGRPSTGIGATPVRKAYEQVADQIREMIVSGRLGRGERLPNEATLAAEFGVSRGTVREALKVLAAQDLIRTSRGSGGGSFANLPTVEHISTSLHANLALLSETEEIQLDHVLELRRTVEPLAARLAAQRRTDEDLADLRDAVGSTGLDFHRALVAATHNAMLSVAVQPIFAALQRVAADAERGPAGHEEILAAVEARDPETSERLAREHIKHFEDLYRSTWAERPRRPTGIPG